MIHVELIVDFFFWNNCCVCQIHLYSDGGIDISKDGKYLFTCARVHYPPALQEFAYGNPRKGTFGNLFGTFSPNSHPARLVADERESKLRASGSGFSSVLSRGHPKSSEFEMPRPGGRLSYLRFPTSSSSSSSPSSSEVPNSAPSTQGKSSLHDSAPPPPLFLPRNLRIENDNIAAPPPPAVILGMSTPPPTAPRMPTSARTPNSGNSTAGSSSSTTQQQRHPPQQASPNVPGTAPGSAFSVPPRSSSNNSSSAYPAGDSVLGDDKDGGGLSLQEHLLHQLSLKDPVVSSTIDGVPVVVNMSTSATSVLKGSKSTAAAGAGAASVSETSPLCGEKKAGMSPMVDSKELNGADPSDLFAPTEGKLGSFGANVCEARLSAPYPRQKLMQLCDKTPPGENCCLFLIYIYIYMSIIYLC